MADLYCRNGMHFMKYEPGSILTILLNRGYVHNFFLPPFF